MSTKSYPNNLETDFEKYTGIKRIHVLFSNDSDHRMFPSSETTTLKVLYLKESDTAVVEFKDDVLWKFGQGARDWVVSQFAKQYREIYGDYRLLAIRDHSIIFETPPRRDYEPHKGSIH